MKIAILTLPLHTNYGGILQAYALQTVLERMGHHVEHLQPLTVYPSLHPVWQMPMVWLKRCWRKFMGGERALPVFAHPHRWVRKHTDAFIHTYIHGRYLTDAAWNELLANDYDLLVVGSDQVWRPLYAIPIEKYFASFLSNSPIRRIAYAASFGTDAQEYTACQQQTCAVWVSRFDSVSVRESSGVELCQTYFGKSAQHVLDPTMLLTAIDYKALLSGKKATRGGLMVYVLDESEQTAAFVNQVARCKQLVPFRANSKMETADALFAERQQPPVENWLQGFAHAEYVITDSFHACVFSILFNKPFLCIGNQFRGMSRFRSLLEQFQLQDRLVSLDMPLNDRVLDGQIDWEIVNKVLDNLRSDSMAFLRKALA